MSTTITPTEQNIEINVNNDVIDINVTNEIVDVNATTQQIDINVAGAYPLPNPVLSVFGRTGLVVATEGDYTLTQLGDVTLSSPSNGQVLKYNGTAWVNGLDAGGITTLNTLTALSQYFATGTSGSDFNISSATATHTFNLPTASATNRGALSSADWTTFNNKQNALTNPITGTGTSGQVAYFNGTTSLTSESNLFWDAINDRLGIGGTPGAFTLDVNGTAKVGTSLTILSPNALQNLVISHDNSDVYLTASASTSSIRANKSIRPTTNNSITLGSFNLIWSQVYARQFLPTIGSATGVPYAFTDGSGNTIQSGMFGGANFLAFSVVGTEAARFADTSRNLLINTTTDAGFRLDVNGTARVQGVATFTIGSSTLNSYLNTIDITQTNSIAPGAFPTMGLSIQGTYTDINAANNTPYNPFLNVTPTINFTNSTLSGALRSALNLSPIWTATGSRDINNGITLLNIRPSFTARNVNNITGILYNPTFTLSGSLNNHIAIQTVSGDVLLCTTSGNVAIGTSTLATATELTLGGSQTASSAIARGGLINTTLVAAANNDVLVGLDINPTFTNGAFTGVTNLGLRVTGGVGLINSSGTNRSTQLTTSFGNDNLPAINIYPLSGTNVGQSLYVIPKGTGFGATVKSQFLLFNTDFIADQTNYEAIYIRSAGASFNIASGKAGTGTNRPILLSSGFLDGTTNPNQFWAYTSGNIGINTSSDAGFRLDVNGTARVQTTLTLNGATSGNIIITSSGTNDWVVGGNAGVATRDFNLYNYNTNSINLSVNRLSGNVLVNTSTDAGFRLDVNGTARVQGTITSLVGNGNISLNLTNAAADSVFINTISSTWSRTQFTSQSVSGFIYANPQNTIQGSVAFPTSIGFVTNTAGVSTAIGTTLGSNGGSCQYYCGNNSTINGHRFFYSNSERFRIESNGTTISDSGTINILSSALLNLDSTNRGFLPPRMTSAQKNAISSPATGLVVYDTTLNKLSVYTGAAWETVTSL
jgi:hypothetical protein